MLQNEHKIRNGEICQYCGNESVSILTWKLLKSVDINENHISLYCKNCHDVYVGCHKGIKKSLGILSDLFLRNAKSECHKKFDFIWQNYVYINNADKDFARSYCYLWLNEFFGFDIKNDFNHIGKLYFNECIKLLKFLNSEEGVEIVYEFIERYFNLLETVLPNDKKVINRDFELKKYAKPAREIVKYYSFEEIKWVFGVILEDKFWHSMIFNLESIKEIWQQIKLKGKERERSKT